MPLIFKTILPGCAKTPAAIIAMPVEQVITTRVAIPRPTSRLFPRIWASRPANVPVVVVQDQVTVTAEKQDAPYVSNLSQALDDFVRDCIPVTPAPEAAPRTPVSALVAEAIAVPESLDAGTAWTTAERVYEIATSGKATLTVTDKVTGYHTAFRIRISLDGKNRVVDRIANDRKREYVGHLNTALQFFEADPQKYTATDKVRRLFARWWSALLRGELAARTHTQHMGHCCRCGRDLTDPVSIDHGIGPECHKAVFGRPSNRSSIKFKRV